MRRGSRSVASAYRHKPNSGTHTPMDSKLADLNPNRRIGFGYWIRVPMGFLTKISSLSPDFVGSHNQVS